jgi:predicted NAD/FAD-binding protein
MRVAIVGTGISGLVCAHELHDRHDIVVFEANDRIGGHTNTVRVDLADETHWVDTGFIVHNEANYPNFVKLMKRLGVTTQPSDMSFSVHDDRTGVEYRGTSLATLFAQPRNALRPWFSRLIVDIVRFNKACRRLLVDDPTSTATLAELVDDVGVGPELTRLFLVPMGAALWSADPRTFLEFPAITYARFMDNHRLLEVGAIDEWRTISGGSRRYIDEIIRPFADRIRLSSPVHKVVRGADAGVAGAGGVELVSPAGPERFDAVIFAAHSDQALGLLGDPSAAERDILGAIAYQPNRATLHTDTRLLPAAPRARASWNYHVPVSPSAQSTVTYWMNNLQAIRSDTQFMVTLNRDHDIDPASVLASFDYAHPVFDLDAIAAQARRSEIQGARGTWFAGAYWGYGFHEDGVRSALDVVAHLEAAT